ncbi:MAG: TonB-dependent receptor [Gammaproteobacteria bacterium]|nr:TonB-dependent receptor [Gammaproteobacteria bacterium]
MGNELPGSPGFSLTGKVDWSEPLSDSLTLEAVFWVTYSEGSFRDILNDPDLRSDDYTTFNARLELLSAGGASIYISGTNIFDAEYVTSRRSLLGMLGEYYGAPRSFLGGVRYEF